MVQPRSTAPDLPAPGELGPHPTRLPARYTADLPAGLPVKSANRPVTARRVRARNQALRQVKVIEVGGRLRDVVDELDRAVELALAEGPRGVVCDLSGIAPGSEPAALEMLATAGRHVREWPGIPLAVACPDLQVHEALVAHPLGGQIIVETTLFSAVTAVLATPAPPVEWLRLAPHPTAPRASREFVTRTLLDWRLGRAIPFATLVVSELVASSSVHAGTEIDLSIAWSLGALRLTVRDHGPALAALPGLAAQRHSALDLHGRGLTVVAGLSRAFGVMPTADGGKVVWAVLDAIRPRPLNGVNGRIRSGPDAPTHESPVFTDGLGLAERPFCAGPAFAPLKETTSVQP